MHEPPHKTWGQAGAFPCMNHHTRFHVTCRCYKGEMAERGSFDKYKHERSFLLQNRITSTMLLSHDLNPIEVTNGITPFLCKHP